MRQLARSSWLNRHEPPSAWRLTISAPPDDGEPSSAWRLLDLRMGVFDLKMDPSGVPVFLELNPQGQFLFVEGLTGMDLIGAFSGFLRDEALAAVCD